jgi:hypothetical protein
MALTNSSMHVFPKIGPGACKVKVNNIDSMLLWVKLLVCLINDNRHQQTEELSPSAKCTALTPSASFGVWQSALLMSRMRDVDSEGVLEIEGDGDGDGEADTEGEGKGDADTSSRSGWTYT